MANEAVFTYGPPLQGRNIRLIEIRLGSEKATLEITLREYGLESEKFEALSYVWGKHKANRRIKCNGRPMYIRSHLLYALKERACRKSTVLVWADAICINQNDDQEKTSQVHMMRDIYERAQKVIIWLGKERAGDREGAKLVESLYTKCNGANNDMDATTYDFEDFDCESNGVPKPFGCPDWDAVFTIISHPWFNRVWVVQELLVAQRSVMWRGSLNLNTDAIIWMSMQVDRHKNLYECFDIFMGSPRSSALMARNIATSYIEFKSAGPIAIYDTLSQYNGMEATDRRDRYFALAGISSIDASFINYAKSFRDIACLVGKMTLFGCPWYKDMGGGHEMLVFGEGFQGGRFLIEWLAFHTNPQNYKLGIPSWIPDLLSPHSPGLIMSGFYNTSYMQKDREISSPRVRLRKEDIFYWTGCSPPSQCCIPVPDASKTPSLYEAKFGS
jgi:hypothetical protein